MGSLWAMPMTATPPSVRLPTIGVVAWNAGPLVLRIVLTLAMFEAIESSQVWCAPSEEPAMRSMSKAPITDHRPRT